MTVDELYRLPDDGTKHELRAGTLVAEPLPGFRHGWIALRIGRLLGEHVDRLGLGAVLGNDAGFVLTREPDTVRGPDVAFVRRERLRDVANPSIAFPGAPDLAVEILSPSETRLAAREKVAEYLAAGTRLVWLLDPETETVAVFGPSGNERLLDGSDFLDGEDVVPGFRVSVAELFDL